MSHGVEATEKLKSNIQDQLSRLLTQLEDLEELREELDADEYEETRQETMDQLKEFDAQLKAMAEGDVSLVSRLGHIRLAMQAAVSQSFKTSEVIKMFAKREPDGLRTRLSSLIEAQKLGRLSEDKFKDEAVEILVALKKLGEELTDKEKAILEASDDAMAMFESADKAIDESVLGVAGDSIKVASGK